MSGYPDFASLVEQLSGLSAKIEGKSAIFDSGHDDNGVLNRGNAGNCLSKYGSISE